MAFTSLRKTQPTAPAPADTEDTETTEPDDAGDGQEQPAAKPDDQPPAFPRAVVQGVRGWLTWCSNLVGPGWTWVLHAVAVWAAGYYDLRVTIGVSAGLTVAVAAFIPRGSSHRLAHRIEQLTGVAPPGARKRKPAEAAAAPADAPAQPPADPLVTLLWQLIGEASGVHLKTLTEALAEGARKRGAEAPAKAEVEASLEARGIRLRDSVRDARKKVNRGVYREDLLAALQPPPPPSPDAPAPAP
ncbi:hypothetical protein [Streptomyces sp. NPDC005732]|uniref:hypothetical protein n=1 Tax=Streptomyces sp. NPDC005732 TaxID=3157057 RepID=UPI0033CEB6EB